MTNTPIGYIELQSSWIGTSDGVEVIAEERAAELAGLARRQYPGHRRTTKRVEAMRDGAGVMHYTLYVGYAPRVPIAEPLNANNLNDAPVNNIGDPARDNAIGAKEQRF